MIEVICNDRLGKKVRVKVNEDDTIGDLKKLIAAQVDHAERPLFIWPFLTRMPETSHRPQLRRLRSPLSSLPQVGTRPEKIRIQKWYTVFKDHITLEDYEIHDGMGLEMYYN